jgi:hypothetical protein
MGSISEHNVSKYIEEYRLTHYVETGTGIGECLSHVIQYPFDEYHTIEIYEKIYNEAVTNFSDNKKINLHHGNSYETLPTILSEIDGNVLFWLDAHFPGVDFHYETFDSEKDYNKRLPLESELRVIKDSFDTKNSVLIIDDLRIYEDGPYHSGNWSDRHKYGGDGIEFIYELFGSTHDISKDFQSQGYIIIQPKK